MPNLPCVCHEHWSACICVGPINGYEAAYRHRVDAVRRLFRQYRAERWARFWRAMVEDLD